MDKLLYEKLSSESLEVEREEPRELTPREEALQDIERETREYIRRSL